MHTTLRENTVGFLYKSLVIAEFELRKLRHDFTELITRALQPALWLLIFGQVFAKSGAIKTGDLPYLDFIAPGILAQSVLFIAIFFGINVIWERDLGIVQKFLVSPTPRGALVLGKGLSAGIRSLSQAIIVFAISALLGVKINWNPFAILNVIVIVILAATLFATVSLIIACIVKTRERFMGVGDHRSIVLFYRRCPISKVGSSIHLSRCKLSITISSPWIASNWSRVNSGSDVPVTIVGIVVVSKSVVVVTI
jgi:ABC-2 type transport system permease protein